MKIRGTPTIESSIGDEERSKKKEKNKWVPAPRMVMLNQAMLVAAVGVVSGFNFYGGVRAGSRNKHGKQNHFTKQRISQSGPES